MAQARVWAEGCANGREGDPRPQATAAESGGCGEYAGRLLQLQSDRNRPLPAASPTSKLQAEEDRQRARIAELERHIALLKSGRISSELGRRRLERLEEELEALRRLMLVPSVAPPSAQPPASRLGGSALRTPAGSTPPRTSARVPDSAHESPLRAPQAGSLAVLSRIPEERPHSSQPKSRALNSQAACGVAQLGDGVSPQLGAAGAAGGLPKGAIAASGGSADDLEGASPAMPTTERLTPGSAQDGGASREAVDYLERKLEATEARLSAASRRVEQQRRTIEQQQATQRERLEALIAAAEARDDEFCEVEVSARAAEEALERQREQETQVIGVLRSQLARQREDAASAREERAAAASREGVASREAARLKFDHELLQKKLAGALAERQDAAARAQGVERQLAELAARNESSHDYVAAERSEAARARDEEVAALREQLARSERERLVLSAGLSSELAASRSALEAAQAKALAQRESLAELRRNMAQLRAEAAGARAASEEAEARASTEAEELSQARVALAESAALETSTQEAKARADGETISLRDRLATVEQESQQLRREAREAERQAAAAEARALAAEDDARMAAARMAAAAPGGESSAAVGKSSHGEGGDARSASAALDHDSGVPWQDAVQERLRITEESFGDAQRESARLLRCWGTKALHASLMQARPFPH